MEKKNSSRQGSLKNIKGPPQTSQNEDLKVEYDLVDLDEDEMVLQS